ncbi:alanine racemase [Luteimonas pelagia]
MARPTTVTIDLDALRHNLQVLRGRAPRSRLMAMVKADAYGHGLVRVGKALSGLADAFGVASLQEAESLRAAGIDDRILVLSGIDGQDDLARFRAHRLDAVVHDGTQLDVLAQAPDGVPLRCWLKVDSGMHRLGFAPADVRAAHDRLRAMAAVDGDIHLMTHFASSDAFEDPQTARQAEVFAAAVADLPGPRSLANSAAVLGWPQAHADWIRPGGALYGMSVVPGTTGADFGLRPAMRFTTRLLAVKDVAAGEPVGYSATWCCPEDMRLGVAAVGYGDGYPRLATAGTPVLVDGRIAQVVGRVSMDLVTIDLRRHPAARAGDPVVLWGAPDLPVEHVAERAGTIAYDLTCAVSSRVAARTSGGPG